MIERDESPLISIEEIAQQMGWSMDQAHQRVYAPESEIPSVKTGRKREVLRAAFEAWRNGEIAVGKAEPAAPDLSSLLADLIGAEVTFEVTVRLVGVRPSPAQQIARFAGIAGKKR